MKPTIIYDYETGLPCAIENVKETTSQELKDLLTTSKPLPDISRVGIPEVKPLNKSLIISILLFLPILYIGWMLCWGIVQFITGY